MFTADLYRAEGALCVADTFVSPDLVVVAVDSRAETSCCPLCGQSSDRIHSRYHRTLADLPTNGRRFVIRLRVRRFRCPQTPCPRVLFCERLPGLAEPYARSTRRLHELHRHIGLATGGQAGSRLSQRLAAPVSGDTILRRVKTNRDEPEPLYRYVGIDDFALRKGHVYGTILVDLERGQVIDLFEGRDGAAVEAWLKAHPGVEVVTRDRASSYANAAAAGAPQARQVADRWHLLHNLLDALKGTVDRHHADVQAAVQDVPDETSPNPGNADEIKPNATAESKATEPTIPKNAQSELSQARRARRLARYERVRELHRQGVSLREIARQLGLGRETVHRFVHADVFPERASRVSRRTTDPFRAYLRKRFAEGCHNAAQLFHELTTQGYRGSYDAVRRQLACWRSPRRRKGEHGSVSKPRCVAEHPSTRRVSWLLLKDESELTDFEHGFRDRLLERCEDLRLAAELGRDFRRIVRERKAELWDGWLKRALETSVREVHRFAEGLREDEAAVRASLDSSWSNGPVEGQVGRLKFIKRSGYGRAGLALLRARVKHKV